MAIKGLGSAPTRAEFHAAALAVGLDVALHPNELSPRTLPRLMNQAGVDATTWVDRDVLRSGASEWTEKLAQSPAIRLAARVAGLWPFRLVLGTTYTRW